MYVLRLILFVVIILACKVAAGEDSQPLFEATYQKQNAYGVMLYGAIEEMPETGAYVKVEGHYSGNNLTAYEIEVKGHLCLRRIAE